MHLFVGAREGASMRFGGRGVMVHYGLRPNAPYGYVLAFRPVITAWDASRFSLSGRSGSVTLKGGPGTQDGPACVGVAGVSQRYR
jgi:hypothetical protein